MSWKRWILMLLLLAGVPLGGCGDSGNSACEACVEDDECQAGLVCQPFRENATGNIFTLCGDANPAMTCPAPQP